MTASSRCSLKVLIEDSDNVNLNEEVLTHLVKLKTDQEELRLLLQVIIHETEWVKQ